MKSGIVIAGSIIADIVKTIERFPEIGTLAYVVDVSPSVGGCVPNVAIDLAKIDSSIPIGAAGKVGVDENGKYIRSQLTKYGVNVEGIRDSRSKETGFCDVMSVPAGERTFFHGKGANADFSPEDMDLDALDCKILHIGYLLLLDRFDAEDEEYGTVMARFLHDVQKKGIKTSIDVISDSSGEFGKIIIPALKYCNYVIINELECCKIWELDAYTKEGELHRDNIKLAMTRMVAAGVSEKVIIHSKRESFLLDAVSGTFTEVRSLNIPTHEIKGSVGAGDAFCAGCLYGLYHSYSDRQLMEFATGAAACSLSAVNAVDGMKSEQEIWRLLERHKRQSTDR